MAGVMTMTIAAILLIIGLIVLDELYVDVSTTSAAVYNETIATVSTAGVASTVSGYCGLNSFTVTEALNQTDGTTIAVGNYTVNARTGTVSAVSGERFEDQTFNITYTYKSGEGLEACDATNATLSGQGKFGDYFDLIVLAIIIAVVISLLMVVFSMRRVK